MESLRVVLLRIPSLDGVRDAHVGSDVTLTADPGVGLLVRIGERQFTARPDLSAVDPDRQLSRLAIVQLQRRRGASKRPRDVPSVLPSPKVPRPDGGDVRVVISEAAAPLVLRLEPTGSSS